LLNSPKPTKRQNGQRLEKKMKMGLMMRVSFTTEGNKQEGKKFIELYKA
jgi:hypothetical protein